MRSMSSRSSSVTVARSVTGSSMVAPSDHVMTAAKVSAGYGLVRSQSHSVTAGYRFHVPVVALSNC